MTDAHYKIIPATELPRKAWAKISARQKTYIDEFTFRRYSDTRIEAWYAGELLATWDGKGWQLGNGDIAKGMLFP